MNDSFCHDVELTFVGAKVSCPACNSVGVIVARGPRLPDSWMSKQLALEDDLCGCKCYPPPLMHASQSGMFESIEANELAAMGYVQDGRSAIGPHVIDHWIRFTSNERGSLEGMRCLARFSDGSVEHGVFDSNNMVHFDRPNASACSQVEITMDAPGESSGSIIGSLLSAMVG